MSKPNLEEMLSKCLENGHIDFRLRARRETNGEVVFYIYPDSVNGDTLDFIVRGNELTQTHLETVEPETKNEFVNASTVDA